MQVMLHKNATTTPKIRRAIQQSNQSVAWLAREYNVSVTTIRRWKSRTSLTDRSHTAHKLQTTLTPVQEEIVVAVRQMLWLSLDDLLALVHEYIHPSMLRSSLHRLLKRREVSNKPTSKVRRAYQLFKNYDPGYIHMDIKYLPMIQGETKRRYLFVAIDRATRWVCIKIYSSKSAMNARRFLALVRKRVPFHISKILTDNGKEFTDRFVTTGERTPTGKHVFDQLCQDLGIEHRLTRVRRPQTNGMVERFNGRIADILKTHRFKDGEDIEDTISRYVQLYNHQLPQKALGHMSPIQAMQTWQKKRPDLFYKNIYNHKGHDSYARKQICSQCQNVYIQHVGVRQLAALFLVLTVEYILVKRS